MTIEVKNAGVWKDSTPYVKDLGIWKPAQEGYVMSGGVWRRFYPDRYIWTVTPARWAVANAYGYGSPVASGGSVTGPVGGVTLVACNLSYYSYQPLPTSTDTTSARVELRDAHGRTFVGKTVIVNGYPVVLTSYSGTSSRLEWEGGPTGWQNWPFLICGFNRTQDPIAYSKTLTPFTVELLL